MIMTRTAVTLKELMGVKNVNFLEKAVETQYIG